MRLVVFIILFNNLLFSNDLDLVNKYVKELLESNTNNITNCVDSNNTKCLMQLSTERTSLRLIEAIVEKYSKSLFSKKYLCVKSKPGIKYNLRDINNPDKILTLVKDDDKIEILSNSIYKVEMCNGKVFNALMVNYNNTIGLLSKKAISQCK